MKLFLLRSLFFSISICFLSKISFAQSLQGNTLFTHKDSLHSILHQSGRPYNPDQILAFTITVSKKNVKCGGTCDGEAYVSITGGTGPFSVTYYNSTTGDPGINHPLTMGTTKDTLKLLCADTYTIEVIDLSDGTVQNDFVQITAPPTILINFTNLPATTNCANSCDAVVATTVSFGVNPKTYSWAPGGQTAEDPTTLCAGVNTITVTDATGCIQTKSLTVTSPPPLSAGLVVVQPACGSTVGSASVTPSGGTAPYKTKWSTTNVYAASPGNDTISNLSPGSYWVVVKDARNCLDSVSFTITAPPTPTVTITSHTDVSCFGICDGSANATATGGTLPYASTIWTGPGAGANTLNTGNVLCAGTWTLTVTDANGCFDTAKVVITQPPVFTVTSGSDTSMCFNGTLTLNATPNPASAGITYLWTPNGAGMTPSAGNTQSVVVTATSTTSYIITATNLAGCSDEDTVIVDINPLPIITATPSAPQVCVGSCVSITASLNTPGAATFLWTPNGSGSPAFMTPSNGQGAVVNVCPPNNFTYTITGTDANGCVNDTTVTAVVKALPTVTTTGNVTICPGDTATITASMNPPGGSGFSWAGPNIVSGGGSATVMVNPSSPGSSTTYTVTGTDAFGCSDTETVVVTVSSFPTVNAGLDQTICFGSPTTLTATGTPVGLSFTWSGVSMTPASGAGATISVNPPSTSVYTVTGTNAFGCTKTDNVTVTVLAQLPVDAGNDTTMCQSDTIQLLATGAANYSWAQLGGGPSSIVSGGNSANPFINPSVTTSYVVTGTSGSCSEKDTVTIFINILPPVSAGNDVSICIGDTTTLTASGAISYVWSPNGGTLSSPNSVSTNAWPNTSSTYTVTGTDANGCVNSDNIIVTVNSLPTVSAGSDKNICLGSSATINASGAVSYSWTPAAGGLSSTTVSNPTASPIITTTYTVIGTDNNGCKNSDQVQVIVHSVTATASVDTTIFCSGGTAVQLSSSGGGAGGTYSWSPATPTANISNPNIQNPTASPTATTTYTVTVTDINNCFATASVTVTFDAVTAAIADTTSPTACGNNDGAIDLNVLSGIGPYTYSWTSGGGNSQDPSGIDAGAYTVTITDSKGCRGTATAVLDDPSSMTLTSVVTAPNTCGGANGSIDLTVSNFVGVSPFFTWTPGNQTTEDITGLAAGTYNVVVTDSSNCTKALSVTVTDPTPVQANAGSDTALCAGVSVTFNAGAGFTSYSWIPGSGIVPDSVSQIITVTPANTITYVLTTIDANNCSSTDAVTVTVNPLPVADAGSNASICPGSAFNFNASGGGTYSWAPDASFGSSSLTIQNPIANPLVTTTYTVTVTNAAGCTDSDNITLTISPLNLSETHNDATICGVCDGNIDLTVTGGNSPYGYVWSNGGITEDLTGLCLGGYNVIVNDALGCSDTLSVSIQSPSTLVLSGLVSNVSNCAANDGGVDLSVVGGTPPLSYTWTDFGGTVVANSEDLTNTQAGTYTVVVTDSAGCGQTQTFTITQPPTPVISAGSDVTICAGDSTILNVTASGAGNSYNWFPFVTTPTIASPTVAPAATTTYYVTVTSPQMCSATDSVTVNVTGMVLTANITNVSACGATDGSIGITITNGTFPFNYSFGPSPVQNGTNPIYSNLIVGAYQVIVTDGLGCTDSLTNILVNDPSNVAVTGVVANNASCNASNGAIDITATGGNGVYTYAWTGSGVNVNNEDQVNLVSGTYSVTVTDALSCGTSASFTINDPLPIKPNAGPNVPLCAGTSVQLNADTANILTFSWNNVPTLSPSAVVSNPIATPVTTSFYVLTTIDINNCQSSDTLLLTVLPGPNINAGPDINLCSGGSNQLSATGGISYSWTPSLGLDSTNIPNPTANPSVTTVYVVTGFNANGCFSRDSATVFNSGLSLSAITTQPSFCGVNDGSVDLSVGLGVAPYTYQWSANAGNATTQDVNALGAGIYSVFVVDSLGCNDSLTATISNATTLMVTTVTTPTTTCGGIDGTVTATPSLGNPPYTQVWTPGSSTGLVITGAAGIYFITVTDSIGCVVVGSDTIVDPTANPVSAGPDIIACEGSTLNLSVTAGVSYSWSPATDLNFSNLQTPVSTPASDVTYVVSVTDTKNCIATDTVSIDVQNLILSELHTNVTTCSGFDGAINLTVSGGSGSYTYQWVKNQTINVANTQDLSGNITTPISFGNYTVYVSDLISGCFDSLTVSLSEPTPFTVTETHTNPTTCNGTNGSITLVVTAGTNPFVYNWTNGASGQNPTGLSQGVYALTMSDSSGCSAALSVTLTQPTPISYTAGNDVTICYGTSTTLNATPNTSGSFSWTPAATLTGASTASPVATPSLTVTYALTVTDTNNCITNDSVVVNVIRIFNNGTVNDASSCIALDGSIALNPTGGTAPYSYLWSNSTTNDSLINVQTGQYFVTVTEASAFACQETDTFSINSLVPLQVLAGSDTTLCNGVAAVTLTATSVPAQNTVYSWTEVPSAVVIDNDSSLTVTPASGSTTYQVDATNGTCTATDQVVVTISNSVFADAGIDTSIYIGESITIGGNPSGPSGSVFAWTPSATLNDAAVSNPVANNEVTTTYVLTVTSSLGCIATDSMIVTVKPEVKFPNGISPNGDGKNDVWIIDLISKYPDAIVEVFNRWGQNVFTSAPGYTTPWDGTYNGNPLPVGTYYYIIDLKDEKFPPYTGPITIFR